MVGPSNSTNRFGPSSYVVGPTLGDGVNFTSIQAAMNRAAADGYSDINPTLVLVRPGTYTENLIMRPGIAVHGVTEGQLFEPFASLVGSVTINALVGTFYNIHNFTIDNPAGDTITITGNGLIRIEMTECSITCSSGQKAIVMNNVSGTYSLGVFRNCIINSDDYCIDLSQHNALGFYNCDISSNSSGAFLVNDDARPTLTSCRIFSSNVATFDMQGTETATLSECSVRGVSAVGFNMVATAGVLCTHSTIESDDVSGFFVTGTGTFTYGDLLLVTNKNIDPGLSTVPYDWKPYATAAVANNAVRGTAGFDNTFFSVTDGWVSMGTSVPLQFPTDSGTAIALANQINVLGGIGCNTRAVGDTITIDAVTYTITAVGTTLVADEGVFVTAASTQVLPNASGEGTVVEVVVDTSGAVVVQANVGARIRLGNQITSVGGTLTSTAQGDTLQLRRRQSTNQWIAIGYVGNWTVA